MDRQLTIDCIIGIDPGANGGIAVYIQGRHVKAIKMPKTNEDLRDFLIYYADNFKPLIFLEKVQVRPDDIKQGDDGQANMGKIYRIQQMLANFEHLKAIIEVIGIPYVMVHPLSWQKKLNLRQKGEEKAERKRRYKDLAGQYYPGVKITLWNADALLLMHFGRWAIINDLNWVLSNLPQKEKERLF